MKPKVKKSVLMNACIWTLYNHVKRNRSLIKSLLAESSERGYFFVYCAIHGLRLV
jgi:hypothetical protein